MSFVSHYSDIGISVCAWSDPPVYAYLRVRVCVFVWSMYTASILYTMSIHWVYYDVLYHVHLLSVCSSLDTTIHNNYAHTLTYFFVCIFRCTDMQCIMVTYGIISPALPWCSAGALCAHLQIANLLDTVLVVGGLVDIFVSMCLDSASAGERRC